MNETRDVFQYYFGGTESEIKSKDLRSLIHWKHCTEKAPVAVTGMMIICNYL